MRISAARFGVAVLATVACLGAVVACGGASLSTPLPAVTVMSMDEAGTVSPLPATVQAAETANAVAFLAQTAAAQARALTIRTTLTTPTILAQVTPPPPIAFTAVPATPLSVRTPTPVPAPPPAHPALASPPSAYTAAFPLISVADLIERPMHYADVQFSVIGYVHNVHQVRTGTTTFFLSSDAEIDNSIFVSLESTDRNAQEHALVQVYGTGAQTIRVVTNGNVASESSFMRAVVIRPTR